MTKPSLSVADLRTSVEDMVFEAKVLREAGILGPMRPDKALRVGKTFLRWGASPATGIATAAIHHPHEIAIIDERGSLSFERLHLRSNALAHAFAELGIGFGDGIGIMCRNHRGFVEATLAAAKLGASALYLNTMFAGPQLVEVTGREGPKALVYDEEFTDLLEDIDDSVARIVGWSDGGDATTGVTLEQMILSADDSDLEPPPEKPRFVILTSGTTGTPKGAQRSSPDGLFTLAALIDRIPFRSRRTMVIAAPLFHSWGFFHFVMSLPTASTMVLRSRFDPEETLGADPAEPRRRTGGGAGDDPADSRRCRTRRSPGMTSPRCGSPRSRARRCPGAGDRLDGPLRRLRLQPLRLDRGRLRDYRHPAGPAGRAGNRRAAAPRDRRAHSRRRRPRGPPG